MNLYTFGGQILRDGGRHSIFLLQFNIYLELSNEVIATEKSSSSHNIQFLEEDKEFMQRSMYHLVLVAVPSTLTITRLYSSLLTSRQVLLAPVPSQTIDRHSTHNHTYNHPSSSTLTYSTLPQTLLRLLAIRHLSSSIRDGC